MSELEALNQVETEMEDPEEIELDRRTRSVQQLGTAQGILDVGCGEGRLVNFLARQTQKRVVGLDISGHGFAQARREADQTGTHTCYAKEGRVHLSVLQPRLMGELT